MDTSFIGEISGTTALHQKEMFHWLAGRDGKVRLDVLERQENLSIYAIARWFEYFNATQEPAFVEIRTIEEGNYGRTEGGFTGDS
jgi:hypothetical protein